MEENATRDILIEILRSELTETELDGAAKAKLTPDVISALHPLSKKHDLAHIVSAALHKNGIETDRCGTPTGGFGSGYCKYRRTNVTCTAKKCHYNGRIMSLSRSQCHDTDLTSAVSFPPP